MSVPNITAQVAGPSHAELMARIAALEAEVAAKIKPITFKVSEKGALSVYGLNARFPVTLYSGQWTRLIEALPRLQQFMVQNKATLKTK